MRNAIGHRRLRQVLTLALGASAVLPGSPGWTQVLGLPPAGQPLGPPQASPIGPRLAQPGSPTPQVRGDIGERPDTVSLVPARGPALEAPVRAPTDTPSSAQPRRPVLGPAGQPLPGAIRIAPNRIYDPASQRYYWTSGTGAVERVLP